MTTRCPKCQHENPNDQRFCGDCGTQITPKDEVPVQTKTIEAPKEELTTGSTFADRYQIIEELGKGGMGKVYKAQDTEIKEKVAIKLIKPEISADKKTVERFQNELKFARKIVHKNVGRMYDLGKEEGSYYITMEYVEGQDLKGLIKQSKQLTVGTAISIVKQICEGLEEAHNLGVVHRDLKPSNIMIDKNGNARIMDFGIARTKAEKGITDSGVIIGTPDYMSPEQAEAKDVDKRSDIYSLGVILYEMVTGRVPFEGETALSIAHKHKYEEPQEPKSLNPQIPVDLNSVILKSLAKDKSIRYQKIEELNADLTKVEETLSLAIRALPGKEIRTRTTTQERWATSIAVLPFTNMSADPEQEYFCDGIAEELINALTQIKDLRVVARTSAFSFKGKDVDIEEIGNKLKVDKVLEGSVRKAGNHLRITAQLVNIEDGYHLWSERYDRDLDDVFAIQDDVTLAIVDKMKVKLLGEEKNLLTKRHTDDTEAYHLYLKGRFFWHKMTAEGYKNAIKYFSKAIETDPEYALPYASIALVYSDLGIYGLLRPEDAFPEAKSLNEKAITIDENLGRAYGGLAAVSLYFDWDWPSAEKYLKKAIKFNPGDARIYYTYADYLSYMGRFSEALQKMKRGINLDPLSPVLNFNMGYTYYCARRYDEAMEWYKKALEIEPNFGWVFFLMGNIHCLKEEYIEAESCFRDAIRLTGGLPWTVSGLSFALAKLGKRDEAESLHNELQERSKKEYIHPTCFSNFNLGIGDLDKAYEYLMRAYEEREPTLCMLKVEPVFDLFQPDPRFDELLQKMNLK